jgi:3'-phosphoadenosine 5'-phosphosulfate sulfotransferase (PAPS reductase)/FAD synthetase
MTPDDLRVMQSMPLDLKVRMTRLRITEWVSHYGEDGVYIGFSGGKDSTVLLHIARSLYPDILAVFVDTGLEFPEIRAFVRTFENVEWLRPEMTFKQVIETYGYPMISKNVSNKIHGTRNYLKRAEEARRQGKPLPPETSRYRQVIGTYTMKNGKQSEFNCPRYRFLLDAPFEISSACCDVMKKRPLHKYNRETGRFAMTAQMAYESLTRRKNWLKNGCNGFNMAAPISNPMAFWTEQDVLRYIKDYGLPFCPVYGEIIESRDGSLVTTGLDRTGCMFCGFGCHLEKRSRFVNMKRTHPKQYDYIMRPKEKGGLNYKEVIDWINEHGSLHIEY